MNRKGFAGHYGLERYEMIEAYNLGSQVPNEEFIIQVLLGEISPGDCPLFGKVCTPATPQGACMVSAEGSCFHYYSGNEGGSR